MPTIYPMTDEQVKRARELAQEWLGEGRIHSGGQLLGCVETVEIYQGVLAGIRYDILNALTEPMGSAQTERDDYYKLLISITNRIAAVERDGIEIS